MTVSDLVYDFLSLLVSSARWSTGFGSSGWRSFKTSVFEEAESESNCERLNFDLVRVGLVDE